MVTQMAADQAFTGLFIKLSPYLSKFELDIVDRLLQKDQIGSKLPSYKQLVESLISLLLPRFSRALIKYAYYNPSLVVDVQNLHYVPMRPLIEKKIANIVLTRAEEILITLLKEYSDLRAVPNQAMIFDEGLDPCEALLESFLLHFGGRFFPVSQKYIDELTPLSSLPLRELEQSLLLFEAFWGAKTIGWREVISKINITGFRFCNINDSAKGFFKEQRISKKRLEEAAQLVQECILFNPLWQEAFVEANDPRAELIGIMIPNNTKFSKPLSSTEFIGSIVGVVVGLGFIVVLVLCSTYLVYMRHVPPIN